MNIFSSVRMLYSAAAKMLAVWCVFTLPVAGVVAQPTDEPDTVKVNLNKLLDLSFEDLMNVKVITPTQNLQKSMQAPATVKVVKLSGSDSYNGRCKGGLLAG
jgi:hypothetical protein